MAEVFGTIGNQPVELNNAATETTLRALLEAVRRQGGAGAAGRAGGLAASAGINPDAIKAASTGLNQTGQNAKTAAERLGSASEKFGSAMGSLIRNSQEFNKKLIEGTAQSSDFINIFSALPGIAGKFASALTAAAKYQEENLKVYQQITTAGINFAGSLTDIRMAAGQTRLTLDQLNGLLTKNGDLFARLGDNADQGAKNFIALSSSLQDSQLGRQLRNLGYTTDEINQSMANYVAATGGRTRAEMQNTTKLAEASAAYMFELDALATITGKNRQQLEEEGKKAAANAAYQRKLASLSEEERTKLEVARKQAIASGIAGAEDLVMSTALGLPPMTKAAQMLSGYAPGVASGFNNMTKAALDQTKTVKDVNSEFAKTRLAAKEAAANFGQVGDAVIMQGGEAGNLINSIISEQNKLNSQGIENEEDAEAQREAIEEAQRKRQASQASDLLTLQQALEKMRIAVLEIVNQLVSFVTPAFRVIGNLVSATINPALDGLSKAIRFLMPYVDVLTTALSGVWEWYTSSMEELIDWLTPIYQDMKLAMKPVIDFFKSLGFTTNELQQKFDRIAKGFQSLDEMLGGKLSPTLAGVITALGAYLLYVKAKTVAEKARDAVTGATGRVTGAAQSVLGRRGYSVETPLYVQIVRGVPGAGGGAGGGGPAGGGGGSRSGGGTAGGGGGAAGEIGRASCRERV